MAPHVVIAAASACVVLNPALDRLGGMFPTFTPLAVTVALVDVGCLVVERSFSLRRIDAAAEDAAQAIRDVRARGR